MQKLQCTVSNSVSHYIVIPIYPNGFHVCMHAFDEHGTTVPRQCARLSQWRSYVQLPPCETPSEGEGRGLQWGFSGGFSPSVHVTFSTSRCACCQRGRQYSNSPNNVMVRRYASSLPARLFIENALAESCTGSGTRAIWM